MLKLSLGRSRYLTWLMAAAHAGALTLLWPLDLLLWVKAAAGLAVTASLFFFLNRAALLRAPEAVIAVEIGEDGRIALQTRRGDWHACRLSGDSFVSPWLTIMILAQENRLRARYVVIVPDNVDAGDFRRLRVWMRWSGHATGKKKIGDL